MALPILTLMAMASCKNETQITLPQHKENGVIISEATVDTTTSGNSKETLFQKVDYAIWSMGNLEEYFQQQLAKAKTKIRGNEIYEEYQEAMAARIGGINELETDLLENYSNYYDQEQEKLVFPDSIQKRVDLFKDTDLEFWEIGEGFAEIRFKPYHYYTMFKGKVTQDYEYFLQTEAKENTELFSADAGLGISFKEVGDRVLSWEKFLKEYPTSGLLEDARQHYQYYGYTYLMGMDNTPTFEFSDGKLYRENRQEFKRFIAQNPNSDFAKIVKAFLAKFDQKATFDDLQQFARKELNIVIKEEPEEP